MPGLENAYHTIRQPLISIGIPVYNGGSMLRVVLDGFLKQTFTNFEVIISDNCSTDETSQICAAFRHDNRFKYIRQSVPLKAFDNFRYVLDQARAPYFMFAAHDDLRSDNLLDKLFAALENSSEAVLAFPNLELMSEFNKEGTKTGLNFATINQPFSLMRMLTQACIPCYHIYGLWRTDVIREIPFIHTSYWPDLPIMMAAAAKGRFIHVPEATFAYLEIIKTDMDRIKYQDLTNNARCLSARQLHCVITTFKTVASGSGMLTGMFAAFFVFIKFAIFIIIIYSPRAFKDFIKKLLIFL